MPYIDGSIIFVQEPGQPISVLSVGRSLTSLAFQGGPTLSDRASTASGTIFSEEGSTRRATIEAHFSLDRRIQALETALGIPHTDLNRVTERAKQAYYEDLTTRYFAQEGAGNSGD